VPPAYYLILMATGVHGGKKGQPNTPCRERSRAEVGLRAAAAEVSLSPSGA
jgi:hypothetical protein